MKKALLTLMGFCATVAFSQTKITSEINMRWNPDGGLAYVDSFAYDYVWDYGALDRFEPEITSAYYDYAFVYSIYQIEFDYATKELWSKNAMADPFNYYSTTNKTYLNGNVSLTETANSSQVYYTYDGSNRLTEKLTKYYDGFSWIDTYKDEIEYSPFGKESVIRRYEENGSLYIYEIDSVFYDGNGNVMSFDVWNSTDGITFSNSTHLEYVHSNDQLVELHLYQDHDANASTPMLWVYKGEYVRDWGLLKGIKVYQVFNGIPETTEVQEIQYDHNALNQVIESRFYFEGNLNRREEFNYNSDNLLQQHITFGKNTDGFIFMDSNDQYYYESSANTTKLELIDMNVYPNPVVDELTIETNNEIEQITVVNALGQKVLVQKGASGHVEMTSLEAGSYTVIVKTTKGIGATTVIK